jgi:hypothetical protein
LIAILFASIPALLACRLVRKPWHAYLPLLIVGYKLMFLAPCLCTGGNWEPRAIYRAWFVWLLILTVVRRPLRWRVPESGTGLTPG